MRFKFIQSHKRNCHKPTKKFPYPQNAIEINEFKRWGEGVTVFEIEQMGKAGIEVGGWVSVERSCKRGQMHSTWTPHLRIWWRTPLYGELLNSISTRFRSNRFKSSKKRGNTIKNLIWLHVISIGHSIPAGELSHNCIPFNFTETWRSI